MHEYSITKEIVKIVEGEAKKVSPSSIVKEVTIVIGEGTGFIPESIQMYFDAISEGSLAEGAQIKFEVIKPKLKCKSCGKYFERKKFASFKCPHCNGDGMPSEVGKEFYIKNITVR